MADWGGFTEEDLRELNYPGKINMGKPPGGTPRKQANFGKQKGRNANRDRSLGHQKKRVTLSDVVEVMPVQQMLSPESLSNGDSATPDVDGNNETKPNPVIPKNTATPPKSVLKPSKPIERHVPRANSTSTGNEGNSTNDISLNNSEGSRELDEDEALRRELNQIQKFQHQQKLIEEKNKQTKTLLTQAIKERRARAESEAHLLTDLQKELSHLDNLLTTDVSIIRDRIETASLEFSESQKRYEKAEKEFIVAKMDMFRRAETKEKLTEHLYTIIYQNEMRKAQKLSELMEMLELTTKVEEVECILPAIPPIPMYNTVQTLHSPSKTAQNPQASNNVGVPNHVGGDPGKPDDQKVVNKSEVSSESKEPLSESSASPPTSSVTPEVGQEKPNDTKTPDVANVDVPSPSEQTSPAETAAMEVVATDSSAETVKSPESEKNVDCENKDGASSGNCDVSNNNSIPEAEKISTSLQTKPEEDRTSKDKITTLKELAQ